MKIPTIPGWYLTGHSGLLIRDTDGTWCGNLSNAQVIAPKDLPSDLIRVNIEAAGD